MTPEAKAKAATTKRMTALAGTRLPLPGQCRHLEAELRAQLAANIRPQDVEEVMWVRDIAACEATIDGIRAQIAAVRRRQMEAAYAALLSAERRRDHQVEPWLAEMLAATLNDDAAATLFAAGVAARFAAKPGFTVLWALSRFDLYAPGLEQAGLRPDAILYAEARKDSEVLALAEDGLRDGSLACVVAEVRAADQTATRRLQLAASEGGTPMLLYRRHRSREHCPLSAPSSAMTRWRIGCVSSGALPHPGVGRARWAVELVRQRGGNPFALELEACDDTGRLALPSAAADRAATAGRAAPRAA